MSPASARELSLLQLLKRHHGREAVKRLLSCFLSWKPLHDPQPGHTVVVGVPWDLRHLLHANLTFVNRMDKAQLFEVVVVFDRRRRAQMEDIESATRLAFPELPLRFISYPRTSGGIVELVNVSTFYNSMNTVLAIASARTRTVILHDFDLYPLRPDYFFSFQNAIESRQLHFCGLELTEFDGLEKSDLVLGTWALAIDAQWLRGSYKPVDCFHRITRVRGQRVSLDPYSWIQLRTQSRALVEDIDSSSMVHIKNMCSTYLRYLKGEWVSLAWRMHSIWYLAHLSGNSSSLQQATEAMASASDPSLEIDGRVVSFKETDVGATAVLREEITRLEESLYGQVRSEVESFLRAFEGFLLRFQ